MSGTNTAVALDLAPRWRAWIWFSEEIPTESPTACVAHLHGQTERWGIGIAWEGDFSHDEVTGEVSWHGPELKPGDTLRLYEGDREFGMVRILESEEL